jgi:hypothetical protein
VASVFYVDQRPHFEALQSARKERPRQLNTLLVLMNVTTWIYAAVAGLSTLA